MPGTLVEQSRLLQLLHICLLAVYVLTDLCCCLQSLTLVSELLPGKACCTQGPKLPAAGAVSNQASKPDASSPLTCFCTALRRRSVPSVT